MDYQTRRWIKNLIHDPMPKNVIYRYVHSMKLTRDKVEQIAFDPNTPQGVAMQFQATLMAAQRILLGQHPDLVALPAPIRESCLHFVVYADCGLKLVW